MVNEKISGTIEEMEAKEGKKGIFHKLTIDRKKFNYYQPEMPEGITEGTLVDVEYSESEYMGYPSRTVWKLFKNNGQAPVASGVTNVTNVVAKPDYKTFNSEKEKKMAKMAALKNSIEFWKAYIENERALGKTIEFNLSDVYETAADFEYMIMTGEFPSEKKEVKAKIESEEVIGEEEVDLNGGN